MNEDELRKKMEEEGDKILGKETVKALKNLKTAVGSCFDLMELLSSLSPMQTETLNGQLGIDYDHLYHKALIRIGSYHRLTDTVQQKMDEITEAGGPEELLKTIQTDDERVEFIKTSSDVMKKVMNRSVDLVKATSDVISLIANKMGNQDSYNAIMSVMSDEFYVTFSTAMLEIKHMFSSMDQANAEHDIDFDSLGKTDKDESSKN